MPAAYGAHFLFCCLKTKRTMRLIEWEAARGPSRGRRGRRDESPRGSGDEIEIVTYSRVSFVNPAQWRAQLHPPPFPPHCETSTSFLLLYSLSGCLVPSDSRDDRAGEGRRKRDVEWNRSGAFCSVYVDTLATFIELWLGSVLLTRPVNYACEDLWLWTAWGKKGSMT